MKTTVKIAALAAILIGGAMLASCMSVPEGGSGGNTFVLHYYRFDKNYDGWNVWCWPAEPNDEGEAYEFGPVDAEGYVTCTVSLPGYVTEYGYIVRKSEPGNDWAAKDTADDRFTHAREVWVIQDNPAVYTSKPNVP
jgi:pullulanase